MNRFLVVGLGNPGKEYENTRHNAGFMFLDTLNLGDFSTFEHSVIITKNLFDMQVTFMKPMTYMNLSGIAVSEFINFYKVSIDNMLVIYDDIYLPVGKLRIKSKGSCGGHNGMRNIIDLVKTPSIKRLKIGVGNKPSDWDLDDWVVSKFSDDELSSLKTPFENSAKALDLILQGEILKSMNLFN